MQRGELDRLSLSVSLYTPGLQTYLRRLKNNPATIKSLENMPTSIRRCHYLKWNQTPQWVSYRWRRFLMAL